MRSSLAFLAILAALLLSHHVFSQDDFAGKSLTVQECLKLSDRYKQAGDIKEASRYMNTAATKVWEEHNYEDAIKYFNQSIELNQSINNASGIAKLHTNLGMIYSDIRDFDKSLHYFQFSLDYRLKHGEKSEIISTYINKAVVLNSLHNYTEAAKNLEEALRLATEMSDAAQMKSCYGMLAETYEKAGNQERTIHYFNLYRTFHEMVQRNKVIEANKETEAAKLRLLETELEKKEQEIMLMSKSNELRDAEAELEHLSAEKRALVEGKSRAELAVAVLEKQLQLDEMKISETEARNSQQKIWIGMIVAGLILLSALLIVLYRAFVYRKNTNMKLSEQNEEIKTLNENLEQQVQHRTSELRKTLANLEKRNRDLDQFSHVISHNLRGPVANILGLGQIVNRNNLGDPLNVEVFDRLKGAAYNLDSVVKDLSTILQVTDNQAIPKDRVVVKDAIQVVKNMLNQEIEKSGISITVDDRANQLNTVKPYFESILYNILSNSVKYSASSSNPKATIKTSLNGQGFIMSIEDNGMGINNNDLDKIFEPYKRLTLEGEGKGLGLYLVRTQVEALGGTVAVTSEEGKGSVFTVRLPQ